MKKIILLIIFIILCVSQIFLLSYLVYQGVNKGTVIKLKCGLYDPYDFIKGHYLYLQFFMENQKYSNFPIELKKELSDNKITNIYCILSNDYSKITKIFTKEPEKEQLFLKAKVLYTNANDFRIEFPFNKYYIQENLAPLAEKNIRMDFEKLNPVLHISVDKKGNTRIEKLEVNGMPIEKYILNK